MYDDCDDRGGSIAYYPSVFYNAKLKASSAMEVEVNCFANTFDDSGRRWKSRYRLACFFVQGYTKNRQKCVVCDFGFDLKNLIVVKT